MEHSNVCSAVGWQAARFTAVIALATIALPIPFEIGRWLISINSMVLATAVVFSLGSAILRLRTRAWGLVIIKFIALAALLPVWGLTAVVFAFAILAGNNFVVHAKDTEECQLVKMKHDAEAVAAGGFHYRRLRRSEMTGWLRIDDALYCTRIQLSQ